MAIIGRAIIENDVMPAKGYIHSAGFEEAFSGDIAIAERYLRSIVTGHKGIYGPADYVITIAWGKGETRVADLYRFRLDGEWPCNPEWDPFIFEDGIWIPKPDNHGCGDGIIVLSIEEQLRRLSQDPESYMRI